MSARLPHFGGAARARAISSLDSAAPAASAPPAATPARSASRRVIRRRLMSLLLWLGSAPARSGAPGGMYQKLARRAAHGRERRWGHRRSTYNQISMLTSRQELVLRK